MSLYQQHPNALFVVAGLALFLLLVAIRNAWDTVTFIAEERGKAT